MVRNGVVHNFHLRLISPQYSAYWFYNNFAGRKAMEIEMKNIINAVVLAFVMAVSVQCFANDVDSELKNNLVRLHIVANSNSEDDQRIKLKIRDEILRNVSLDDEHFLQKAEKIANNELINMNYGARAEWGEFYFPHKEYKNITLPCGEYKGVKIILGEGKGENWWCVLYPPVCVSQDSIEMDKKSKNLLKEELNSDVYDIITKSDQKIIVKLKIVEAFNYISEKLNK